MIIFLNKRANNGTACKTLNSIEDELRKMSSSKGVDFQIEPMTLDPIDSMKRFIEKGKKIFVAAGGDGSVHILANALMRLDEKVRKNLSLGAIGLGSSNDFHKPVSPENVIKGVPVRIDHENIIKHNVGHAELRLPNGSLDDKYFIINASFGILAHGNHLFNRGDMIINWLKKKWINGTINYSAIKTMLKYNNFTGTITIDKNHYCTAISNLGIVINPHFSGNWSYDTHITPTSDYICVNLCENMNKIEQIKAFCDFMKGKFLGLPKRTSWTAREVEIEPEQTQPFEMDGEVIEVKSVKIRLIRGALRVCQ